MGLNPPEYGSREYWEARFSADRFAKDIAGEERRQRFEWLGDGSEVLLPTLAKYIERHAHKQPLILNIGCGNSALHLAAGQVLLRKGLPCSTIVNLDFAESGLAAAKGIEDEAQRSSQDDCMSYVLADLLEWSSLSQVFLNTHAELFDVVLDKSTADAISTSLDVVLRHDPQASNASSPARCPMVPSTLTQVARNATASTEALDRLIHAHPVRLLALHLAAVTLPDGIWLLQSYSASRCDVLTPSGGEAAEDELEVSRFWILESSTPIDLARPTESASSPQVQHWAYVLRRTDQGHVSRQP